MTPNLFILALLVIGGAAAAMTLRNLIHCALALALSFLGLAGLFLHLNAQFVGFAQILVYVGAVSIVILFAILLTRGGDTQEPPLPKKSLLAGGLITVGVFAILSGGIGGSHLLPLALPSPPAPSEPTVAEIGKVMMLSCVVPLLATGVLLTAALLGALLLAFKEKQTEPPSQP